MTNPAFTALTKQLQDRASWLVNAGVEDTRMGCNAMTGTDDDMAVLRAAIEAETSGANRVSRLDIMRAKLRKFSEAARAELLLHRNAGPIKPESPLAKRARELREARHNPPAQVVSKEEFKTIATAIITRDASASDVEIVTESQVKTADFRASAQRINEALETIRSHEDAMIEATLEHRLCIGLELAKAQDAFGISDPGKRNAAGTNQHAKEALSRRDMATETPAPITADPVGFSNWLAKEIPDLRRTTAYKYATAFAGTGLTIQDATPVKIRDVVKKLRHEFGKEGKPMPCLQDFYKRGRIPRSELVIIGAKPITSQQLRLEDAREIFHLWQEAFHKALKKGHLDHLDRKGLLELQEFTATVRDRIKARLK
jgi:hypothetical protein